MKKPRKTLFRKLDILRHELWDICCDGAIKRKFRFKAMELHEACTNLQVQCAEHTGDPPLRKNGF